jgi:hypothetical protein
VQQWLEKPTILPPSYQRSWRNLYNVLEKKQKASRLKNSSGELANEKE